MTSRALNGCGWSDNTEQTCLDVLAEFLFSCNSEFFLLFLSQFLRKIKTKDVLTSSLGTKVFVIF